MGILVICWLGDAVWQVVQAVLLGVPAQQPVGWGVGYTGLSAAGSFFAQATGWARPLVEDVGLAGLALHSAVTMGALVLALRLRECNYGSMNGSAVSQVHADRLAHLTTPYPGGESWQDATDRFGDFVSDLTGRWDGARVLVVGHLATYFGLERAINAAGLADLLRRDFLWQPGWEYHVGQ